MAEAKNGKAMREIIDSPLFSFTLTLAAYYFALQLYSRFRYFFFNPVLISIILLIILIKVFNISFENYNEGGKILNFFLGPSVVALGVLLYEYYDKIKAHFLSIFCSILAGSLSGTSFAIAASKFLGIPFEVMASLAPKSTTAPIAMEIADRVGGIAPLAVPMVFITGISGAVLGPMFLKFIRVRSKTAFGTALGATSHGIGTARALEEGETEGAFSGLALCLHGIIACITVPLLIKLIYNF